MFGEKKNTAFQPKNHIPSVKHVGGSIVARDDFAASGSGQLAIIDEIAIKENTALE